MAVNINVELFKEVIQEVMDAANAGGALLTSDLVDPLVDTMISSEAMDASFHQIAVSMTEAMMQKNIFQRLVRLLLYLFGKKGAKNERLL